MIVLFFLLILAFSISGSKVPCYTRNTTNYNGFIDQTITKHKCDVWEAHISDFNNTWDFSVDGSVKKAKNFCRDPNLSGTLWCYSTNPLTDVETCAIHDCESNRYTVAPYVVDEGDVNILVRTFNDLLRCNAVPDHGCSENETLVCANYTSPLICVLYLCCINRGCYEGLTSEYSGTWRHTYNYEECDSLGERPSLILSPDFPGVKPPDVLGPVLPTPDLPRPSQQFPAFSNQVLSEPSLTSTNVSVPLPDISEPSLKSPDIPEPILPEPSLTSTNVSGSNPKFPDISVPRPKAGLSSSSSPSPDTAGTYPDHSRSSSNLTGTSTDSSTQSPNGSPMNSQNYCRDTDNDGILKCNTRKREKVSCGIPSCIEQASINPHRFACYNVTMKDRLGVGLPNNATEEQVCNSLTDKFYIKSTEREVLGCKGCRCCQVRGCYENGTKYQGTWSYAMFGYKCKRWDELNMTWHVDFDASANENFCRDYNGLGSVGCYVSDESMTKNIFMLCGIQVCRTIVGISAPSTPAATQKVTLSQQSSVQEKTKVNTEQKHMTDGQFKIILPNEASEERLSVETFMVYVFVIVNEMLA